MKKLVFMFVACATMSLAVSFSSCGNGAANDSDSVVNDTLVNDTLANDTAADSVVADTTVADSANA